jgi:hypothetical protein
MMFHIVSHLFCDSDTSLLSYTLPHVCLMADFLFGIVSLNIYNLVLFTLKYKGSIPQLSY